MIFLCVLLAAAFLLVFPIFIYLDVDKNSDFFVRILYFIKVKLPDFQENSQKKSEKKSKKKPKKKSAEPASKQNDELNIIEKLQELSDILGKLTKKFGKMLKHFKVTSLILHVNIAGSAPDSTAIMFGAACAVIYPALSLTSQLMGFDPTSKRCDIQVVPDYSGADSAVKIRARIFIIPICIIASGISILFTGIKGFIILKSNNTHKNIKD